MILLKRKGGTSLNASELAGTSWYPAATQLVPAGTSWYQLVPSLVQAAGTQLVPAGTQLVPSWYQPIPAGTSWYPAGTSWYPAGTELANQPQENLVRAVIVDETLRKNIQK